MHRPPGYFFPTLVPKDPELTTANGFFLFSFCNTVHCMVMQIKLVVVFVCADSVGSPGPVDLANITETSVQFSVGYVQKNLRDCLQFS